jgi:ATP-dependent Clp protease ATP-binding subunit ClpC
MDIKTGVQEIDSILESGLVSNKIHNLFGGDDEMEDTNFKKVADNKNSKTPILDNFGVNLNKKAKENKIGKVIGRDAEIERVVQILSRKNKNNVIILGESGVGKTTLAEGLALKIQSGECNRTLENKVIYSLNISTIVAGSKYRGQLEERLNLLIKELVDNKQIILFIDEIHTIIGAGSASGSLDVANIIKPALSDGSLQVIASTTNEEYRKHIEKDPALVRRFQKIVLNEPSELETTEMLFLLKENYEEFHKVKYTDDAIRACANLTSRYIMDRHQPDKSFDIIDEIGSRVKIRQKPSKRMEELNDELKKVTEEKIKTVKQQNYEIAGKLREQEQELQEELKNETELWYKHNDANRIEITKNDIEQLISELTGIPIVKIGESDMERLYKMEDELSTNIIGQDNAVKVVSNAIRLSRMGLSNPNKPATLMFIGKSGVGKTEMVKQLAKVLFDNEDMLIRLDMSEYSDSVSVNKLIGSSAGYVGYEDGSKLINEVRQKPYSVILLDEIEKAHPNVFNTLLQVFDAGRLKDGMGNEANFKNCVIIMTSNVGVRKAQDDSNIGFNKNSEQRNKNAQITIEKELKKVFSPEFLNRIDKTVYFNTLTQNDIIKIVDIELKSFSDIVYKMNDLGHTVEYTDAYKAFIAKEGYDTNMGVRPLKRAILRHGKEELAMYILKNNITTPLNFTLDYDENIKSVVITHKEETTLKKRKKKVE